MNDSNTTIAIDFSDVSTTQLPVRMGIRRATIQTAVKAKQKEPKTGENVECTLEFDEGNGEKRTLKTWTATTSGTQLLRIHLSSGLEKPGREGIDISQWVGRSVVVFVKNDLQPDPINPGQMLERSNVAQFVIPTDTSYDSAQ